MSGDQPVILITTFHPSFNDLQKIIRINWDMLAHSARTKTLHETRLIMGLRKPPTIRSLPVRAKIDYHPGETRKHKAAIGGRISKTCLGGNNCRYCPWLNRSGRIKSGSTGIEYEAKHNEHQCNIRAILQKMQYAICRTNTSKIDGQICNSFRKHNGNGAHHRYRKTLQHKRPQRARRC